jgi:hypothetical protein
VLTSFSIHLATLTDVPSMVSLSEQKRHAYERAQPQFWRRSENANEEQAKWFIELLSREDQICLVAKENQLNGFIIGKIMPAPEVYNPGGPL